MNEEILKRLDVLAAKLGVGAGEMWRILLKEARVEGVLDLAIAAGCLLVALCIILLYLKVEAAADEPAPALIGIGSVLVMLIYGYAAVCELANPEYYALHEILKVIK